MRLANKWLIRFALAPLAMLAWGASARALDSITDDKYIFHPPQLDYKSLCKESGYFPISEVRSLLDKQGNKSLSGEELFRLGLIYEEGLGTTYVDHPKAKAFFERALVTKPNKYEASTKTHLARLLLRGRDITRDSERALKLLKEATKIQAYTGGFVLGQYLDEEQSYVEAETYYKLAAAEGNPNAILHLVYLYKKGFVNAPSETAVDDLFSYAQNIMLERINEGKCSALYRFGKLYLLDRIVDKNEVVAAEWLAAAAQAGHVKAMLDLATLYRKGIGVNYDQDEAITLWKAAASEGAKDAMFELGFADALGDGVDKNFYRAIEWLTQAAQRKHLKATVMLADIYTGAFGDENIDSTLALKWLLQAAQDPLAKPDISYRVGEAYKYGRGTERNLEKSFEYFERAAKAGNKDAAQELANAYRFGWGVEQQPIKSLKFTRLASNWGNDKASYYMAEHYRCGIGKKPDQTKALRWIDRAIAQGNAEAMLSYAEFIDGTEDEREAVALNYLKKAANSEISKAMALLAIHEAVNGNKPEVDRLIKNAIDIGDEPKELYLILGRAYIKGTGLDKNVERGLKHLRTAVRLGSESALYELSKYLFKHGDMQAPDLEELKKNIAKGHVDSLLLLAKIYSSPGFYDEQQAIYYHELAALHGSIDAMLILAMQQHTAVGGGTWINKAHKASLCDDSHFLLASEYYRYTNNINISARYLQKAAKRGNSKAMRYLAALYNDPTVSIYDQKQATAWMHKAAKLGDSDAIEALKHFRLAYH